MDKIFKRGDRVVANIKGKPVGEVLWIQQALFPGDYRESVKGKFAKTSRLLPAEVLTLATEGERGMSNDG